MVDTSENIDKADSNAILPEKKSVLFGAMKGVALGAVIPIAVVTAETIIRSKAGLSNTIPFKKIFSELYKKDTGFGSMKKDTLIVGMVMGTVGAALTLNRNHTIDETMPYIKKLENERSDAQAQQKQI